MLPVSFKHELAVENVVFVGESGLNDDTNVEKVEFPNALDPHLEQVHNDIGWDFQSSEDVCIPKITIERC